MPELNEQQKQRLFDNSQPIADEYEYLKLTYPRESIAENYLVVQWTFFYGEPPQPAPQVHKRWIEASSKISIETIDLHVFAIVSQEWIKSQDLVDQVLQAAGVEDAESVKGKVRMRLQALAGQAALERQKRRKFTHYRMGDRSANLVVKPGSNRSIALELLTLAGGGQTGAELAAFAESTAGGSIKFDLKTTLDGLKRDRLIMAERDGNSNRYWLPHQRQSAA